MSSMIQIHRDDDDDSRYTPTHIVIAKGKTKS